MKKAAFNEHQLIDGIHVYYEFYPMRTTKTIVLLHGFLSSTFSFRHLIPLLNEEFQVLSIDLPPFGKSEKSKQYVYSYKNMALTVIKLIESLNLTDVTLIGHSMGGQIVLNILHFRPKLAEKAILLSSSSYLKRSPLPHILISYLPFSHFIVKHWLSRSGVLQNLKDSIYNHSLITEEMITRYMEPFLKDDIFVALTRMLRHREGDLPPDTLKRIETPCLLIWGEHDKCVPLQIGEQLNEDLVNSELIILKETGHAIMEERPEEAFHHIKNFLS